MSLGNASGKTLYTDTSIQSNLKHIQSIQFIIKNVSCDVNP